MRRRKARGIARDTLKFILEASRSSIPNEFAGLLQTDGDVITEVLILPGTESSRMSALVRLYMLPNMQVVGSVHSHPSANIRPSDQDLIFFSRAGDYNIIVGPPFNEESWACYDILGNMRELPILDIEFKDDDFDEDL
ncbi:MAG: metal-dependent protease of the PAD1/JAB1 superfamily [Methanotrichaceae archaeon]|nr:metal-dependent protease of the PAD1/JAB1 superfamily [Methanotrichaceae archaeon]